MKMCFFLMSAPRSRMSDAPPEPSTASVGTCHFCCFLRLRLVPSSNRTSSPTQPAPPSQSRSSRALRLSCTQACQPRSATMSASSANQYRPMSASSS